ncbi:hypothetical protein EOD41_10800 [Mucilaginibacter limnophilus]|uniref:Uncharacterized protein n=1 Tax=Mucilaginibacter limnophilus TaxID=1932778 RepID=A0A437MTV1_9SPHI|nr:hypothetical protein [Mucilaginibacter limnophilus]RVU01094.1 hypothetical protein EOD41_10800 [Mucilaginibacter limnophilus]
MKRYIAIIALGAAIGLSALCCTPALASPGEAPHYKEVKAKSLLEIDAPGAVQETISLPVIAISLEAAAPAMLPARQPQVPVTRLFYIDRTFGMNTLHKIQPNEAINHIRSWQAQRILRYINTEALSRYGSPN